MVAIGIKLVQLCEIQRLHHDLVTYSSRSKRIGQPLPVATVADSVIDVRYPAGQSRKGSRPLKHADIAIDPGGSDIAVMARPPQQADHAVIHLDSDQAIVLFELLSQRFATDLDRAMSPEENVLSAMLGQLEKQLVAPFRVDYADLLSTARHRLAVQIAD